MDDLTEGFTITHTSGGVTAPRGFTAGASHCGIKSSPSDLDLAVLAAEDPVSAAALFTTHPVPSAPVTVSRQHLAVTGGVAQAIVINSGSANACTGPEGYTHAKLMTAETAAGFGCIPDQVLVASTGVIGVRLPLHLLSTGIRAALGTMTRGGGAAAARAIMTTDRAPKEHAMTVQAPRGSFTVGGMAKGSAMIEPNMATLLAFLTTDAAVEPGVLQQALQLAARETFNAMSVDGECSMNDSLFALASGASGVVVDDDDSFLALVEGMFAVSRELVIDILRGADGATKVIAVTVNGATSDEDARRVARTVANSLLVKTAVHGADPNWGRIVAAAGRSGVTFDMDRLTVRVGDVLLFERGVPDDAAAPAAGEHMKGDSIRIDIDLGAEDGASGTIWTCDLSAEYVRINSRYRADNRRLV